jgi:thioredoxin 1
MANDSKVKHFSDNTFEAEVKSNKGLVLVDFWATWCAPCRAIAPILEELAQKFEGKATIGKLNVDEEPNTARAMGIRALPTLLLFKNGQVVEQIVGAVGKDKISSALENNL